MTSLTIRSQRTARPWRGRPLASESMRGPGGIQWRIQRHSARSMEEEREGDNRDARRNLLSNSARKMNESFLRGRIPQPEIFISSRRLTPSRPTRSFLV
ncbi:hypothetical protein RRG08_000617 [Elysia crispata]|uniref:Uncharacterized protein n=1 Tax=Elysia crispata TaxID=231223 RepID=A0AAE0Y8T5_9GAST|nr:hypothetical protein RRG08_000617 [Elysia crispata]